MAKIEINKLTMWDDNVRFDCMSKSEKDCIEKIFSDKKLRKKTLVLLDDIISNKAIRENLIVYVENNLFEKKFIVLDGNRRISLFKIINYEDLIKKYSIDETKIRTLNSLIKEVDCTIYSDLNQAYDHVEKRHCGENGGAGIVKWSSKNTERMRVKKNSILEHSIGYKIMEFYKNTNDKKFEYVKNNIKDKSTLDRIFGCKPVFNGIFNLKSNKEYNFEKEEHISKIDEMLTLFYKNDMNVTNVYTVTKTEDVFKNILPINKIRQTAISNFVDLNDKKDNEKQNIIKQVDTLEEKKTTESIMNINDIERDVAKEENTIQSHIPLKNLYKSSNRIYLFCWKSENIKINNDIFKYYLKECIDYYSKGIEKNSVQLILTPYFYRILLETAFREFSTKIKEGKLNRIFNSNTSFEAYIEQREIDSAITKNRIANLFELEKNMFHYLKNEKREIVEMLNVLKKYGMSQKAPHKIQNFIEEINEIVHGRRMVIDYKRIEEIDEIVLNIIKIISYYLNIERR